MLRKRMGRERLIGCGVIDAARVEQELMSGRQVGR
jgi:hypothetical protein